MSTKIYNGFRFTSRSLLRIHEQLMALRPAIQAMQHDGAARYLSDAAVRLIDNRALGKPSEGKMPLMEALTDMWDRQAEIKKTGYRDPAVDWDFSLAVLPFKGRVYGIVYTEKNSFRNCLLEQDWVEDYSYWDNADRPEGIAADAWERRRKTWAGILSQDPLDRPGGCGFGVDILPDRVVPDREEILSKVPDLDTRCHRQAVDRVMTAFMVRQKDAFEGTEDEWKKSILDTAMKATSYVGTEAGKAEVSQEASCIRELLPFPLTIEHLLGTN